MLVAVFAQSKGITNEPQPDSAVCIYSMHGKVKVLLGIDTYVITGFTHDL